MKQNKRTNVLEGLWNKTMGNASEKINRETEPANDLPSYMSSYVPSLAGYCKPIQDKNMQQEWNQLAEKKKTDKTLTNVIPESFLREVAHATYTLGGNVIFPIQADEKILHEINDAFRIFLGPALEKIQNTKPEEASLNAFRYQLQDIATERLFKEPLFSIEIKYRDRRRYMREMGTEYDFVINNNTLFLMAKKTFAILKKDAAWTPKEPPVGFDSIHVSLAINLELVNLEKLLTQQPSIITERYSTLGLIPPPTMRYWSFAKEFSSRKTNDGGWQDIKKKEITTLKEMTPEPFLKSLFGDIEYMVGTRQIHGAVHGAVCDNDDNHAIYFFSFI